MLAITRKPGESFTVGNNIIVTISDVDPRSRQVRVHIQAPRALGVFRQELLEDNEFDRIREAARSQSVVGQTEEVQA